MRIAFVSGSIPTTTFIDALANGMAEEGFEIFIIGKQVSDYSYHKNIKAVIVPDRKINQLLFILKHLLICNPKDVSEIIKESKGAKAVFKNLLFYLPLLSCKPDRVHIQWAAFIHKKNLLFDLFKNKVVLSLRGAHINYTPITKPEIKASYLKLFPLVHKFHAVSEEISREALKYGAASSKTEVIYSMVDDSLLNKKLYKKEIQDKLRIISVGRFFWKKGYGYALDALYKLKQINIPFTYTLIAQGDTPDDVKFQIHQLGLESDVQIVNGKDHESVLKRIEEHDVLLMTSVEEGLPNVVLEAMALGTLVVATEVGGVSEVIEHNKTGLLAVNRDVSSISNALQSVLSMNEEDRFMMAIKAQEVIKKQHSGKIFKEKFTAFYKD